MKHYGSDYYKTLLLIVGKEEEGSRLTFRTNNYNHLISGDTVPGEQGTVEWGAGLGEEMGVMALDMCLRCFWYVKAEAC